MFRKVLTISSTLALVACGGGSGTGSSATQDACKNLESGTFNCSAMLNDLVEQAVRPVVSDLKTNLTQLNTDTISYCNDIDITANLNTAKESWLAVMNNIQQLQAMEFGPSANTETGLSFFYSWEETSPLNVDIAVAKNTQSNAGLSDINNRKELKAIEYILFSPGTITNTESQNADVQNWITATNGDTAAIQNDRCDYAKLVTANLATKAVSFENSWNTYDLSSEAATAQAAANEVTDALFFADKKIKDAKVKAALPQATNGMFDESKLESQYAFKSKDHLINNLKGLKRIFTANGAGQGLDDYLTAAGESDVATLMIDQIDQAITNLEAIEGTLYAAVVAETTVSNCIALATSENNATNLSDIEKLCNFQYTIKQFTDELKEDFIIATQFTTPASASGDND
ncbi:MAG: putative lipoprotein [Bermanella sp.]|jgi:predicted lipoprotein